MADLRNAEALIPPELGRWYPGVMVSVNGVLSVNVNGSTIPARYADPLVLSGGDPVLVTIIAGAATGQAEAFVICRTTASPRPGTGTVKTVPPSSPTITVTGSDNVDYTASFASTYTPVVNDLVELAWGATTPFVISKIGVVPALLSVSPVAPAPGPSPSGSSSYAATDSATYWSGGGWDSWAGGGGNVYTGTYGSTVDGAWFYAGSPSELSGRTITRVQFWLAARRAAGSYNSQATVNFYSHTNVNRPAGDVSVAAGPFAVNVPAGWGGGSIDLPTSFGAALQSGGGISISGDPYVGFNGRLADPSSGLLALDWSR